MFLGLLDPDPLVIDMDPDPLVIGMDPDPDPPVPHFFGPPGSRNFYH
jgi:hypothetical protein